MDESDALFKASVRAETPTKVSGLIGLFEPLQIAKAWNQALGPALSKKVSFGGIRPNKVGQPCLFTIIDDPIWAQELLYQKELLLKSFLTELEKLNISLPLRPLSIEIIKNKK